ncbi:antibiotic biosynthesis monooxygenase family protein [Spirillospora sp. NPDC049652]
MIAITRFRVPAERAESFAAEMAALLSDLATGPGHRAGRLVRTVDDPELWALITEWDGAGFYRRALGAPGVRMRLIPLAAMAIDEPGAYEEVL